MYDLPVPPLPRTMCMDIWISKKSLVQLLDLMCNESQYLFIEFVIVPLVYPLECKFHFHLPVTKKLVNSSICRMFHETVYCPMERVICATSQSWNESPVACLWIDRISPRVHTMLHRRHIQIQRLPVRVLL